MRVGSIGYHVGCQRLLGDFCFLYNRSVLNQVHILSLQHAWVNFCADRHRREHGLVGLLMVGQASANELRATLIHCFQESIFTTRAL